MLVLLFFLSICDCRIVWHCIYALFIASFMYNCFFQFFAHSCFSAPLPHKKRMKNAFFYLPLPARFYGLNRKWPIPYAFSHAAAQYQRTFIWEIKQHKQIDCRPSEMKVKAVNLFSIFSFYFEEMK